MNSSYKINLLTENQIDNLLSLQSKNLKSNLSKQQALELGFLTFTYDTELIKKMLETLPQPTVLYNNELVAYALATDKNVCKENELLKPIIDIAETIYYKNKKVADYKYYILGQICVGDQHKGQGLFRKLYEKHKELFSKDYDIIVTEISTANQRSLAAHKHLGFEIIHQYTQGEVTWDVVVWDLKN